MKDSSSHLSRRHAILLPKDQTRRENLLAASWVGAADLGKCTLRGDWVELAGVGAPTAYMLQAGGYLQGSSKFVGVDRSPRVLAEVIPHFEGQAGHNENVVWCCADIFELLLSRVIDSRIANGSVFVLDTMSPPRVLMPNLKGTFNALKSLAKLNQHKVLVVLNVSLRAVTHEEVAEYKASVVRMVGDIPDGVWLQYRSHDASPDGMLLIRLSINMDGSILALPSSYPDPYKNGAPIFSKKRRGTPKLHAERTSQVENLLRTKAMSSIDISQTTGIPGPNVRAILATLSRRDKVFRSPDKTWHIRSPGPIDLVECNGLHTKEIVESNDVHTRKTVDTLTEAAKLLGMGYPAFYKSYKQASRSGAYPLMRNGRPWWPDEGALKKWASQNGVLGSNSKPPQGQLKPAASSSSSHEASLPDPPVAVVNPPTVSTGTVLAFIRAYGPITGADIGKALGEEGLRLTIELWAEGRGSLHWKGGWTVSPPVPVISAGPVPTSKLTNAIRLLHRAWDHTYQGQELPITRILDLITSLSLDPVLLPPRTQGWAGFLGPRTLSLAAKHLSNMPTVDNRRIEGHGDSRHRKWYLILLNE